MGTEPTSWQAKVYKPKTRKFDIPEAEYDKVERQRIRQDGYRCQACLKRFRKIDLGCHHIIPVLEGGLSEIDNLITLCQKCHDIIEELNFRSYHEIRGYTADVGIRRKPANKDEVASKDWHRWVYGDCRNPLHERVD